MPHTNEIKQTDSKNTTFNKREQKNCLVFVLLFCEFIVSQSLRSNHRFYNFLKHAQFYCFSLVHFRLVSVKVM